MKQINNRQMKRFNIEDFKGTKGEWEHKSNELMVWVNSPLWHVCTLSLKDNNEQVENAKLIAQSPAMLSVLVQIQNARFDKKFHGEGLGVQENGELLAINEILENIL